MRALLVTAFLGRVAGLLAQSPAATLNIYYIDTEGGQSTSLWVRPVNRCLSIRETPATGILGASSIR